MSECVCEVTLVGVGVSVSVCVSECVKVTLGPYI